MLSQANDVGESGIAVGHIFCRIQASRDDASTASFGIRAVYWNENGKMNDLNELLSKNWSRFPELRDWWLTTARGVSEDGKTISGTAYYDRNASQARSWILKLR